MEMLSLPSVLDHGSSTSASIGITWKACSNPGGWEPPPEFPGDVDALGRGLHLETHLVYLFSLHL